MTKQKQYSSLSILSQNESARLLNISTNTFRTLKTKPGFPPRRDVGGTKGWLYRELEEYVMSAPIISSVEGKDEAALASATIARMVEKPSKTKKTA